MKATISTASVMSQASQKFYFSFTVFLEKKKRSLSDTPQYSLFCLVIRHQYLFHTIIHFSTISDSSIQSCPLVFQTKGCLNFQKQQSIIVSEKIATGKIFENLPVKHPGWIPFKYTLELFKKLFRAAILQRTCTHLLL